MKAYSKDTLEGMSIEQLQATLKVLKAKIADGNIEWKNSKGDVITCPWNAFNAQGALMFNADTDPALWDVGRRVQIRCEAERQNAGNQIASFKAQLVAKSNTLTATVRTTGLRRANCKVTDQLAEAQSVLGNAGKVSKELFERAEKERMADMLARDREELRELETVKKEVALEIKLRAEKTKGAVKEAFVPTEVAQPATAAA